MTAVSTTGTGAWVRRFRPAPQAPARLVCFPHAGGSATFYFPVAVALASTVDVLAIQYPGRQDRHTEPCLDSVAEIADACAAELRPWCDRPIAFFGHSLGATVAFEVARRLEADGVVLTALFASGRRAPSAVRDERTHLRDDDGLIAAIRQLNGTARQVLDDEDILRMILPAVRADYRAAETYRCPPGPGLSCPVQVLTGDRDPHVTPEEAQAWERHTDAVVDVKVFPGGHFYLNSHSEAVIAEIRRRLRT